MKRFAAAFFCFVFLFPSFLFAEKTVLPEEINKVPPPPLPVTMEIVPPEKGLSEPPEKQWPDTVLIITREDIERRRVSTLDELLRGIPGIHLNKAGGPGHQVTVFTRGGNPNQTRFLIDGVEVNSLTGGDFNFGNLTTDNIESVEIRKGPQSVLYGPEAASGVINVITRKGTPEPRIDSWFEYGSLRTFYEGQNLSGGYKDARLAASWSRLDTGGLGENDRFQDTNVSTKFNTPLTDTLDAEFSYFYTNGLLGIDDAAFAQDPNRFLKTRKNVLNSKLSHHANEHWDQSLKFSFFHDTVFTVDPPDPGTAQAESVFKLDADVYRLDWRHVVSLGEHDRLTAGFEFEHERANNKLFDKLFTEEAWYAENVLELFERLYLSTGVRMQRQSAFGFHAEPEVGLTVPVNETGTTFRTRFGTAYRIPTLNQLFFPVFGDPSLEPEKSKGAEAGIDQKFFSGKASAGATYFYNYYDNLIEQGPGPVGIVPVFNAGASRIHGLELETGLVPFAECELKTFYTLLYAETIDERSPLIRRPRHSGGADLNWFVLRKFRWNLHLTLIGDRPDSTFVAGRPGREINPGYAKLDTAVIFPVKKTFEFYARVENLTNDHYGDVLGFDAPGIGFFGGVKLRLSPETFKKDMS